MNERIEDAPSWLYDEFQHAGVDYANIDVAKKYESRHLKFRDFEAEFERIRERADLKRSDVVLDLGCGTGAFAIPASRYCAKVYAADVSAPMLGLLRQKIAEQKIENIETFAAGFLTFPTLPEPVDAVMFNLGWLPGGDKSITTLRETTLPAIEAAIDLMDHDAIINVAVYPGHEEGDLEGKMICDYLAGISRHKVCATKVNILNSPASPYFIVIETKSPIKVPYGRSHEKKK